MFRPSNLREYIQYLVYALVILLPFVYFKVGVYPQLVPKTALFQVLTSLIFFLWLGLVVSEKRLNLRPTPVLVGVVSFGVALVITAALGIDPWRSFWSLQERSLGVVTIIHGIGLFLALVSLRETVPWDKVWRVSLYVSGAVALIALFQLLKPDLLFVQEAEKFRPGSTFGNPTFMAGYLLFHVFLGLYFLLREAQWSWRRIFKLKSSNLWLEGGATLLSFLAIVASQTRGSILGVGVGLAILIIGFAYINRKTSKRFIVQIVLFSGGVILLGFLLKGSTFLSQFSLISRFQEISFESESFIPRLAAYQASWEGFKERPIWGWGWDNFNVVYDKYYDPQVLSLGYTETRFDKPHNFILEYLVAGGMALLLIYIYLIGAFLSEVYVVGRREEWARLFLFTGALYAAYAIHLLFVFETIGPLLTWFLLLAWIDALYQNQNKEVSSHKSKNLKEKGGVVVVGFLAVCLAGQYFISYRPAVASYYQALGFSFIESRPQEALEYFDYAASIEQPLRWVIQRDYAALVAQSYFRNPQDIPREYVEKTVTLMEQVRDDHPHDAYNRYLLVDIYNQVYDVNPEYLKRAEEEAAEAERLSPNRQQVLFSLAKTKSLQGDNKAALDILQRAIDLNPEVPDGYYYYGLLAYASGENKASFEAFMKSLELERRFRSPREYEVMGNFLADDGHLEEATRVYALGKEAFPQDLELRSKLGVAYYIQGRRKEAKDEFDFLAKQIDLRQAPGFDSLRALFDDLGVSY
ncbi:MAG: O-antigen ligase family protein [Anaplasmataceae bacterium]|nr:O-antigen ligase family protein [Anaplasmataceae bacterium]